MKYGKGRKSRGSVPRNSQHALSTTKQERAELGEEPLEDAEELAIRRIRNGQGRGATSIEEFAREYGVASYLKDA